MSRVFFVTLGVIRLLGAVATTAQHYGSFRELGIGMGAAALAVLNLDILIALLVLGVLGVVGRIRRG